MIKAKIRGVNLNFISPLAFKLLPYSTISQMNSTFLVVELTMGTLIKFLISYSPNKEKQSVDFFRKDKWESKRTM